MKKPFALLLVAVLASSTIARAAEPALPPDLTKDRAVDRQRTYNLGATGMRGWIYTHPANFFESAQGRTTTAARQILVTHIGKDSPADGVMEVDDVILGAGGKLFDDDARQSIARAIQEAEKSENGGVLALTRWRKGKVDDVRLRLHVLGTYSPTAPYDCPKSQAILAAACKALEKEPLKENLFGAINGLALLSTGKPEYLPRVQKLARRLGPASLKLELRDGMVTWEWGYRDVFLCEYYLITHDEAVLHAIREYTLALAKGQGMFGTFGHGIAPPDADGHLHGSIPPYGPVNATGLISNLAIVLGKRCGVQDAEIDAAVDRGARFFGYYVDKGAIPYGEHAPWPYHDNNGKNAMAAMLFALQDGHSTEARYFAKMVTASFKNREYGHTGQGFSYLWGALGANVGGPAATAAFFKEASWHFDLVRRCDGSFTYDGGEQYGPGNTDDDTYYGKSGYYGLSPNATYVLTYSLPLRKLLITGREASEANRLSEHDVAEAIVSGHFDLDRKQKSAAELVAALGDWSPVARGWAAEELARRPEAKSFVPELIALAEGSDARRRQGACAALGQIKDPRALPVLVHLLSHDDRALRLKAAEALHAMGDKARPVVSDMLRAVVATAEPALPVSWDDPVQLTHGELAAALFGGLLRGSLEGIDTKLLYPAIRVISRNADGMARATLAHTLADQLTLNDVRALGPDILAAVAKSAPADTMFGNEIRMGGFKALTKFRFAEGIEAGVQFAKTQGGHGSEKRTGAIMKEIVRYGKAAQPVVPELRELIDEFNEQTRRNEFPQDCNRQRVAAVEDAIRAIDAATDSPPLRRLK